MWPDSSVNEEEPLGARRVEPVRSAALNEDRVLDTDKREMSRSIRIVSQVGMRLPAHCSGVGKALLAYLPPAQLRRLVASQGLPSFARNTIIDLRGSWKKSWR